MVPLTTIYCCCRTCRTANTVHVTLQQQLMSYCTEHGLLMTCFHTDTSQHSQPQQTAAATHQPAHSGCSFTQAQCSAENVKQMNAIPKICQFHNRKCSTSPKQYRQVIISDIRSGICQTREFSCVHAVQFWVPSAFCSACNNLPKLPHLSPQAYRIGARLKWYVINHRKKIIILIIFKSCDITELGQNEGQLFKMPAPPPLAPAPFHTTKAIDKKFKNSSSLLRNCCCKIHS